jgi:UDP-N-acetylglucosamine--N-acetylmuramyl-(pentapeptide) pyrophosphoryl-undecaprenol N-acetylglucosamine transferase
LRKSLKSFNLGVMVSIAFTGGGTGGHIYPGLAVAEALRALMPCRVFWIGSKAGMDRAIVEGAGLEFYGIPSGKLRRYVSLKNLLDLFKVMAGFFAARRVLRREKPALLFSKGGFVSVPPCAAAASLKIPVFTHESDYSPGLATRINARFARKVFIPYKETAAFFPQKVRERLEVSGNPIRRAFAGADATRGRAFLGLSEGEPVLLVLGGSLGSVEINALVLGCLPELTRYYTVVHQTGVREGELFTAAERYKPYAYFKDEMPDVIAAAELVLCRSGAGTVWECGGLHKPMILLPLRGSGTRGDQVENARIFASAGAAVNLLDDSPESPSRPSSEQPSLAERLVAVVAALAGDKARREAMARAGVNGPNGDDGPEGAGFIARAIVRQITEE